jgi:peptidoglycan/LPS O-acetylase OafA/YrhL
LESWESVTPLAQPHTTKSREPIKHFFVLIDHLRWISALEVVLGHVRENLISGTTQDPQSTLLSRLVFGLSCWSTDAVIVFFVLSGFLVGGKATEMLRAPKLEGLWQRYLVERASRLFVVLWPVLLLAGICLGAVLWIVPHAPFVTSDNWSYSLYRPLNHDLSPLRWVGAFFLLNNFGFDTIQIDGPLWSLSYEWYYYLAALAIVLLTRRHFTIGTCLLLVFVAALTVLSRKFSPSLLPLGSTWLFGAVAREVFNRKLFSNRIALCAGGALVAAALGANHLRHCPLIILGATLAFVLANQSWQSFVFAPRLGKFLADFSYSLYLSHFPVLTVIVAVIARREGSGDRLLVTPLSASLWIGISVALVAFSWVFSLFTEAKTPVLKRAMLRALERRQPRADATPARTPTD